MTTHEDTSDTATGGTGASSPASVVVCSLEPWGTVRRRMTIMVDELVDLDPSLRFLYVAPAVDVPYELRRGRIGALAGRRSEQVHARVHVLRPRKWLPRALGPFADRSLARQIGRTMTALGMAEPLWWVNDASYADVAVRSGGPVVYDITDDWLLASLAPRHRERLEANEQLLLDRADAVVVCSPDLERTRGSRRPVVLIPNGVDVDLFRTPMDRPADLPPAPVALYAGTLHAERLDVPLVVALARARPDLHIALVGPDNLTTEARTELATTPGVHLLGARPYRTIPAYLQHADVVIVPHLVNPFTESLDPIKAYECLAAGRPTVATPVAGFRGLPSPVVVAGREAFVAATSAAIRPDGASGPHPTGGHTPVPSWRERASMLAAVMEEARRDRPAGSVHTPRPAHHQHGASGHPLTPHRTAPHRVVP